MFILKSAEGVKGCYKEPLLRALRSESHPLQLMIFDLSFRLFLFQCYPYFIVMLSRAPFSDYVSSCNRTGSYDSYYLFRFKSYIHDPYLSI